jgi:hypothetical protein
LKAACSQAAVPAVRGYPKVRRYYERQLKRHQGRGRQMICYWLLGGAVHRRPVHRIKLFSGQHNPILIQ